MATKSSVYEAGIEKLKAERPRATARWMRARTEHVRGRIARGEPLDWNEEQHALLVGLLPESA